MFVICHDGHCAAELTLNSYMFLPHMGLQLFLVRVALVRQARGCPLMVCWCVKLFGAAEHGGVPPAAMLHAVLGMAYRVTFLSLWLQTYPSLP